MPMHILFFVLEFHGVVFKKINTRKDYFRMKVLLTLFELIDLAILKHNCEAQILSSVGKCTITMFLTMLNGIPISRLSSHPPNLFSQQPHIQYFSTQSIYWIGAPLDKS
jgi:hypothetical protein